MKMKKFWLRGGGFESLVPFHSLGWAAKDILLQEKSITLKYSLKDSKRLNYKIPRDPGNENYDQYMLSISVSFTNSFSDCAHNT